MSVIKWDADHLGQIHACATKAMSETVPEIANDARTMMAASDGIADFLARYSADNTRTYNARYKEHAERETKADIMGASARFNPNVPANRQVCRHLGNHLGLTYQIDERGGPVPESRIAATREREDALRELIGRWAGRASGRPDYPGRFGGLPDVDEDAAVLRRSAAPRAAPAARRGTLALAPPANEDADPLGRWETGGVGRAEAIRRIKYGLEARTGRLWSVTQGRGTAGGWLTVKAPPKRSGDYDYMSEADQAELSRVFGEHVSRQGHQCPPDDRCRERCVDKAEGYEPAARCAPDYD